MSSLERAYDHRSQAVNQFIQFYKQHHLWNLRFVERPVKSLALAIF
jgi:hypothetical protein